MACSAKSGAADWPLLATFIEREALLGNWFREQGHWASGFYEFLRFAIKQGWACLFGILLLSIIAASHAWYPKYWSLPRYDALVIVALILQIGLLLTRLETIAEARIIILFHIIGTIMEIFKTKVGSWHYPEFSYLCLGSVPLFSGFMYAAVGSYLFRVWRLFEFSFTDHPPEGSLILLSMAIYANFFADHWSFDVRWLLIAGIVYLFRSTVVSFRVWKICRQMPLLLGFCLVALFIWFAENIGTFGGAWLYPNQVDHWTPVPLAKLISWFLLMLISYAMVAVAIGPGLARDAPQIEARIALGRLKSI